MLNIAFIVYANRHRETNRITNNSCLKRTKKRHAGGESEKEGKKNRQRKKEKTAKEQPSRDQSIHVACK